MSKYIDTEKLKAEIRKLRSESCISESDDYYEYAKSEIIDIIDSLQQEQPEVDLEKEYKTWWNSISGKINVEHIMEWYMHETARHFYELGLNARKEN